MVAPYSLITVLMLGSALAEDPACKINPPDRKDCFQDGPATEERCRNRGCAWCPTDYNNAPWCHYPEGKLSGGDNCPANIPEDERVDCYRMEFHPHKDGCLARGCFWCESSKQGIPWCFFDSRKWPKEYIPDSERIDCVPQGGLFDSYSGCVTKGCTYHQSSMNGAPWCYIPKHRGYKIIGQPQVTEVGYRVFLQRQLGVTMFGDNIEKVTFDVEFQTDYRVRIKFSDTTKQRFEVPLHIRSPSGKRASNPAYDVTFTDEPSFNFKVVRNSNGVVLFDSSIGGLILEDQFLQIATRLPSTNVYGFGEHQHHTFRHDLNWKSWGMFSRDQPPVDNGNLYGVHPYYFVVEVGGKSHGVLFLNSAAQDVTLMPAPALTYRTIGGVLDLYIMVAESPEHLVQEYTQAVGRPFMPPYWSLGFSLAKYGYGSLGAMRTVIDRMKMYDIPQDYIFGDIDYMDRQLDFTYSTEHYNGLPEYVKQLHKDGMRFIAILDPAIANGIQGYEPFNDGNKMDIWVKHADKKTPVEGKVWPPTNVYYPDFTNPSTHNWWITWCKKFHDTIEYDGLWIDMNEPANFFWGTSTGCPNNKINHPPYFPRIMGPNLYYKSLCPEHEHTIGRHYEVHSLYGWSQAPPSLIATRQATGKRSIVLSRSTYPGAGKHSAHWLGDNWSTWESMRASIVGMMEYTHFGIPFIGADICGFIRDSNRNLCNRWQQLGSFYPFSRNHNLGYECRDQDPTSWDDYFASVTRKTLLIRYSLLPYLYTLFRDAHVNGSSVVRPLLHEFPTDTRTYDINYQFLWGPAFMVTPVVHPDVYNVDVYFPDADWYSYYDADLGGRKETKNIYAPWEYIPLWFRGGYVIPTQQPARTTAASRKNPFEIIYILDNTKNARGSLYWDDGESIEAIDSQKYVYIEYKAEMMGSQIFLTSNVVTDNYPDAAALKIATVKVIGLRGHGTLLNVNLNGQLANYNYESNNRIMTINTVDISLTKPFELVLVF